MEEQQQSGQSAFEFEGTWREFAPIAFTNLLLTIVTLGIYRFWAKARERRYLWSRSRFIDERLEWAGTGLELFIGFALVMGIILIPFFLLTQLAQALILRGHGGWAGALFVLLFLLVYYLTGLARFRALRYRLSRTRWHGIRGGSDDQGFSYGWSYIWKNFVGSIVLWILVPWAMAELWNERWNKMSFGPAMFECGLKFEKFFARFLLFYLVPLLAFFGILIFAVLGGGAGYALGGEDGGAAGAAVGTFGFIFAIYLGIGLVALAFYAKYYREAVGALSWNNLDFAFTASTRQWFMLILGDIALVVLTLGVGWIFLSYRHWKFFISHMNAHGEIVLDDLTQSTTATSRHGEGLLDAFDVGAI